MGWHPGCGGAPSLYAELIARCRKDVGGAPRVGGYFRVNMEGWKPGVRDMNIYHT